MRNKPKICSVKNCERPSRSLGYCPAHYYRFKKSGVNFDKSPIKILLRHGLRYHPLYNTWVLMRDRCNNKNNKAYKHYGGRGITVCKEWDSFAVFLKEMGEKPKGFSLDRIKGEKNYNAKNCRWASTITQSQNRKYCKLNYNKVSEIKKLYNSGIKISFLVEKFGASKSAIRRAIRGESWV